MDGFKYERNGLTYRLFCGDYRTVLPPELWHLLFFSPPYNIGPKRGKKGQIKFRGVTAYPDCLPEDVYQAQQQELPACWCPGHMTDNAFLVYNHKDRHRKRCLLCPWLWFPPPDVLTLYDHVIWDRRSTMNLEPSFVRPHHEDLYVFRRPGGRPSFHNGGCSSVWQIDMVPSSGGRVPFPLELAQRIVRLWCPPGGIVCDPYSGTGTTMVAALLEGRSFVGAELMPDNFQRSIKRFLEAEEADRRDRDGAR